MQTQTIFDYNSLGELLLSIDPENNETHYSYDLAGRMVQRQHPDAGSTQYTYDGAGNLIALVTQILENNNQQITYDYDQMNRLISITYPENPENNVFYQYGDQGTGNQTARLTQQQDASGMQEFYYGSLGELIQNIRTFVMPGGWALLKVEN
jgi:YD repeat-containing protein